VKSAGIALAKQRETETNQPRPTRAVDPRRQDRVKGADDSHPPGRLREDWFERTFERVRGFLDEMFD